MGADMKPEPLEFQRRIRSFLNRTVTEAVQSVGRFVDRLHPRVVLGVCAASMVALYTHMYIALPWELWRHLVVDTFAFLLLPFLLVTFSWTIGDIGDFLGRLDPGVELHVWQGRKYYEHVRAISLRRSAPCYDVREDGSEDDQPEEETEESAEEIF